LLVHPTIQLTYCLSGSCRTLPLNATSAYIWPQAMQPALRR